MARYFSTPLRGSPFLLSLLVLTAVGCSTKDDNNALDSESTPHQELDGDPVPPSQTREELDPGPQRPPQIGTGGELLILPPPGLGGAGGSGAGGSGIEPAADWEVFQEPSSRVTDIKSDGTYLYWLEYGTFDQFENYQRDGSLLRKHLSSGEVEVLATELHGPTKLSLTTEEAYIQVDASVALGVHPRAELWHVALANGAITPLVAGAGIVATFGADAVFARTQRVGSTWSSTYLALDDALPPVELYQAAVQARDVEMDADDVFLSDKQGIGRLDRAGVEGVVRIYGKSVGQIGLTSDEVVTKERLSSGKSYLTAMPKSGDSTWQRFAVVPINFNFNTFVIDQGVGTITRGGQLVSYSLETDEVLNSISLTEHDSPWADLGGAIYTYNGSAIVLYAAD